MPNPITVREEREPSLINRYALTGARVGLFAVLSLAALTAASFTFGASVPLVGGALAEVAVAAAAQSTGAIAALTLGAAAFVVGACAYAGAQAGARAVEHNRLSGRTVYPPTLLNEGLGHGLLDGLLVGAAALVATSLIAPVAWAPIALSFVGGAAVIGAGFMSYFQADAERDAMTRDYMKAQHSQMQAAAPALPALSRAPEVTAEDMARLQARQQPSGASLSAVERLARQRQENAMTEPFVG